MFAGNLQCRLESEEKLDGKISILDTFELVRVQHVHRFDAGWRPIRAARENTSGKTSKPLKPIASVAGTELEP